ncbi:MAG: lipoyl synthase [Elusimicrobiota bacterium]
MRNLPDYLIKPVPKQKNINLIRLLLADDSVHSVCESAKCPNIGECFNQKTLTFMILGNNCTRSCAFCGVDKNKPVEVDPDEPEKVFRAVLALGLSYVVITSVTRDDLPDGGAEQFVKVIKNVKLKIKNIEVLIPDFNGNEQAINMVIEAQPDVINHNVETVKRLYNVIRPQADYFRSLRLLAEVKRKNEMILTKSGFMLGLGETDEEVYELLYDFKVSDCDIVTIGQYLPPSKTHPQVEKYYPPEEFSKFKEFGELIGIRHVEAGPFVRSSYRAEEIYFRLKTEH